jgi:hypothetical protein
VTSPAFPRVLVYLPDSRRSIPVTGWLESNAIGTVRCADISFVMRALRDAGPLLGAALIDSQDRCAHKVEQLIVTALPGLPILRWTGAGGPNVVSLVQAPAGKFATRVLEVLESLPP